MEIHDSIYEIVCEQTGVRRDKLDLSTDLCDDLGVSELNMVRIVLALEKQFGISIPDEVIGDLKSVADMERYITDAFSAKRYTEA